MDDPGVWVLAALPTLAIAGICLIGFLTTGITTLTHTIRTRHTADPKEK